MNKYTPSWKIINMHIVVVFNLKRKGIWRASMEETSPECPTPE